MNVDEAYDLYKVLKSTYGITPSMGYNGEHGHIVGADAAELGVDAIRQIEDRMDVESATTDTVWQFEEPIEFY